MCLFQKSFNGVFPALKRMSKMGESADFGGRGDQCRPPLVEIWDHPLAATDADF